MEDGSVLSRMTRNPVRLRRRAYLVTAVVAILNGLFAANLPVSMPALIYPLTWLLVPPIALAWGYGEGFFLQHGIGMRRNLLVLIGGILVTLTSCVLLAAGISDDDVPIARRLLGALANAALFCGIVAAVSAAIAFGLSRGAEYAGRRIQQLDDDHLWE